MAPNFAPFLELRLFYPISRSQTGNWWANQTRHNSLCPCSYAKC